MKVVEQFKYAVEEAEDFGEAFEVASKALADMEHKETVG